MLPIQTVPSRGLPFLVSSRPDIIAVSHLQTDDPFYAPSMFNAREISLLLPLRNLYFGGHLRLRKRHLLILPLVLDVLSHHAQILFRGGLEDPTTLIALDELECATLCIVEPRIRPDQVLYRSQSSGNNFFRELKVRLGNHCKKTHRTESAVGDDCDAILLPGGEEVTHLLRACRECGLGVLPRTGL